jgi:hypothetical protein
MSDRARNPARTLFRLAATSNPNWTKPPCPGAPSQHKQGVGAMLLLRQEIVALLLENGEVGTAKQVESTLPQLVNTNRDEDLLIELGVNIEHLLDERA